jgi:hypothetical protein
MSRPPYRPRRLPKPDCRRALKLLAVCPDGVAEAVLLANGLAAEMLLKLVRAKLVRVMPERTVVGSKASEVVRLRITDAGRRALAEMR